MTTQREKTLKIVLSNLKRHHIENDNERLREALRVIADISEGNIDMRIAKIARAALVSAAPENEALRNPAQFTEGDGA
jgi:hypothetical protein